MMVINRTKPKSFHSILLHHLSQHLHLSIHFLLQFQFIKPSPMMNSFLMKETEYQTYSEIELEESIEDHQTISDQQEEEEDEAMNFASNSTTSLREPSPDSSVLFEIPSQSSSETEDLPILSNESIKIVSDSIITLAPVIAQTLCRYRAQLNEWENGSRVDEPVWKASSVLDQCLLRTVMVLEPVWNQCVKPLMALQKEFKTLQVDHQSFDDPDSNLLYLNKLMKLNDSISIIKENLSDLSKHINDLYDWIDGFLTPILAELSQGPEDELNQSDHESDQRSTQVSILLDAQSYLCIALDSLATNLNLFKVSFCKLWNGLDEFMGRFEGQIGTGNRLCFQQVWKSLRSYDLSCLCFIHSLSVLASVSMVIQNDTIGTLHMISYQA
ncbi:uncharacterized protein MELLADRAFT_75820 [Melampsora larici-populina 98AG31]|uniref:Uncharacterized protein n=1 Tax=Melampsora larici-populina (strain 98AG31 / pathotype 3-4-7) TaxID=747676 RepID=F4S5D4_MELLP|nr:uncharacterized protein MELLADRAFT_75820 [Melampsora larici-populina 98AG31]EGG00180.1 hypothetical protein MELLADRAFT_75820 [Melampsora larici-populina 98AG31]